MGRNRREVGHEIHVLSNMIGRKIDEEKRQRNMGDVSPVQTWVIRYLHDHKGQEICQRDLERDFNITRSTVTGILQLMEKKGYIVRVSVPTIQLKPRKPFPMISLLLVIIMKAPGSFFFRKFRSWTAWLRFMTVRMMNFC